MSTTMPLPLPWAAEMQSAESRQLVDCAVMLSPLSVATIDELAGLILRAAIHEDNVLVE